MSLPHIPDPRLIDDAIAIVADACDVVVGDVVSVRREVAVCGDVLEYVFELREKRVVATPEIDAVVSQRIGELLS